MSDIRRRILHFRFLQNDLNTPISMREYRSAYLRTLAANALLTQNRVSMQFPLPELSPYGGYTVAVLSNTVTNEEWLGVAKCSPDDRFVRAIGVDIAINKATNAMNQGVGEVDELDFWTDKVDYRLIQYLRNNELIRDDLNEIVEYVRAFDRRLRLQNREYSQNAENRRLKHKQHLEKQRERAVAWHLANG